MKEDPWTIEVMFPASNHIEIVGVGLETTGQSDSIPEPGDFSSRKHFAVLASEERVKLRREFRQPVASVRMTSERGRVQWREKRILNLNFGTRVCRDYVRVGRE